MIIAGLGFATHCPSDSLVRFVAGTTPKPDHVAVLEHRAALPAFHKAAQEYGWPLLPLDAAALEGQHTPTQSPRILERFQTGSVAEALALVGAKQLAPLQPAALIQTRITSPDGLATLALAEVRPL